MAEDKAADVHNSRLQYWMFGGFIAGLVLGLIAYSVAGGAPWIGWITANFTGPIGQIFLRLLFMLVIPLLVSALIVGVAEMNEMRALKSIGVRTLLYTIVVSAISVAISLAVVNILQPGQVSIRRLHDNSSLHRGTMPKRLSNMLARPRLAFRRWSKSFRAISFMR